MHFLLTGDNYSLVVSQAQLKPEEQNYLMGLANTNTTSNLDPTVQSV